MGRPKGKALTRDDVLSAGRTCVERDGPIALTLSNVARLLGIKPPSICHHVASVRDLREGLAEQSWLALARRLKDTAPGEHSGHQRLLTQARVVRRFALAQPRSFELMLMTRIPHTRVESGELAQEVLVPVLSSLRALGIEEGDLVHAARALRSAISGFLLLEVADQFQVGAPSDESYDRMTGAVLGGLLCRR